MKHLIAGVKFCGGCNPRFDRGKAFSYLQAHFHEQVEFRIAQEGVLYDFLLVIGGCTNNCAAVEPYRWRLSMIRLWDQQPLEAAVSQIDKLLQ